MTKRIAFFTVGFAYNRLVRMKFYESTFPKDVEIFLITTNKYKGKEKESYQKEYTGLKRTKIVTLDYSTIKLPFMIRKFCKDNKIDILFNLGYHTSWPIMALATVFSKTSFNLNVLTDVFNQYKLVKGTKDRINELVTLIALYPGVWSAKKVMFTDKLDYERAPAVFLSSKKKMNYLAAPVDTELFRPMNKISMRKKLKLPLNKDIVIFTGRINHLKCSDILSKLIRTHPDTLFVVLGRLMDKNFPIKSKNVVWFEHKNSNELAQYYSAADLSFSVNRGGGGIGLSSAEALACGTPILVSKEFKLKNSDALLQSKVSFDEVDSLLGDYFTLSVKDKARISKAARQYVVDNYSNKAWKDKYITAYLN